MTTEIWAGVLLIVAPLWFNATFALLGKWFDYPDILRRTTEEIMERFRTGGASLILLWWAFALSGLLFVGAAVVLSQALGLLRWVYLVPHLARAHADPQATAAQRDATVAVFRAFHQYLGVGVGEHLGYLLTGLWSILIGTAIVLGDALATWLGWPGVVIGAGLMVCSAEFLGPNEERGWRAAGAAIPVLYVAWSIWLLGLGIALIV
jgi:hypothetical protein